MPICVICVPFLSEAQKTLELENSLHPTQKPLIYKGADIMSTKILFVDDEARLQTLILQLFRKQILGNRFCFVFAQNGKEALQKLRGDPDISIVLTDINMPVMDGLTFLAQLKEHKADLNRVLTPIIVSAYDDMANIRKAMNMGAFDFVTKPLNMYDLTVTIEKAIAYNQQLQQALEQTRLAQEALHQVNEELEHRVQERTAELEAFARTVAHDLKNPLSTMISSAQFIIDTFSILEETHTLRFIKLIEQSGRKATKIIDELLLLSSVHKTNVEVEAINMADIIDMVQSRLAFMIEEYDAEIIIPDSWPIAIGYSPWIEQVWLNYLSNALKYGGRPPYLQLGATRLNGAIRFWIRDNGAGIAPQAQATLFTEFTRLSQKSVEGTGLGLSIVKRIVEKLNGEVGVESDLGRGSEFYFTLPSEER